MSGAQILIVSTMLLSLTALVAYLFIMFERKLNLELEKIENMKGSIEHENIIQTVESDGSGAGYRHNDSISGVLRCGEKGADD